MDKSISKIAEKGFLVSPGLEVEEDKVNSFLEFLENLETKPCIISPDLYETFLAQKKEIIVKRPKSNRSEIETKIEIKKNYVQKRKETTLNDWVNYYSDRYERIKKILLNREEMRSVISIKRIESMTGRNEVALIGLISNIHKTFSGKYIITLEDPSGTVSVYLKEGAEDVAGELVCDEVIGVVGVSSKNYVYASKILFPEIPRRDPKKAEEEVYAAFISDIHVGSNMFLTESFGQFVKWMRGETGSAEQKRIADKTKYLFVSGDLVDGVGVYPGQEKELIIKNIYDQYREFAKYMHRIPKDVQIIMIPGNHDALKLAEPQHPLFEDIAAPLYELENATMLSNPAYVNIHKTKTFSGFNVLMYHGSSFDHFVAEVPKLREKGYERGDEIMKFLLKKRHLSPTHTATRIDPTPQDFLAIDKIPDIFTTGHIHYTSVGRYRNIHTINNGCFQDKTEFQLKVGHNPTPGHVPILNLQNNKVKVMRFV